MWPDLGQSGTMTEFSMKPLFQDPFSQKEEKIEMMVIWGLTMVNIWIICMDMYGSYERIVFIMGYIDKINFGGSPSSKNNPLPTGASNLSQLQLVTTDAADGRPRRLALELPRGRGLAVAGLVVQKLGEVDRHKWGLLGLLQQKLGV